MINSNPETVSTDYDISDKLYFEPLTLEHVSEIARIEKPLGAIVQFGGQTPLKLAKQLESAGIPILGTSTESIDRAENREKCEQIVHDLKPFGLKQPAATTATSTIEAIEKANSIGYPVLVRPSYVLGGRGMRIVHSEAMLKQWIDEAVEMSDDHPVLIDRFLDRAIEIDVDAICDGEITLIGGIMEHVEEAGIHSGDSSSTLPVVSLSLSVTERIRTFTRELGRRLNVVGLMNIQFAVVNSDIYLIEINPRASRTVPFISKATGYPLAKIAAKVMLGDSLKDLGFTEDFDRKIKTYNVKAPVFPFHKFPDVDVILGPEMKSTGEVMGRGFTFAGAYAKAMTAAGMPLPQSGKIFFSIRNEDKAEILPIVKQFETLGFELWATAGTAQFMNTYGLKVESIKKYSEGQGNCVEAIQNGKFCLVINTTSDEQAIKDSFQIRRAALERKIPYSTVVSSARAIAEAIAESKKGALAVLPL